MARGGSRRPRGLKRPPSPCPAGGPSARSCRTCLPSPPAPSRSASGSFWGGLDGDPGKAGKVREACQEGGAQPLLCAQTSPRKGEVSPGHAQISLREQPVKSQEAPCQLLPRRHKWHALEGWAGPSWATQLNTEEHLMPFELFLSFKIFLTEDGPLSQFQLNYW